ncbi:MAG: Flp family type IVb pilin [Telluria sp.]|jgi:pilus assembly protein Flp/PilA
MKTVKNAVLAFVRDEEGVTAIEYGLIAALIAAVLVAGMELVGGGLTDAFTNIKAQIEAALT